MKTVTMVKGRALNYEEAAQFMGGKEKKEEETSYEGITLQESGVMATKAKVF
jgi:hypothetical protein